MAEAFGDARRTARQLQTYGQSPDHPILVGFPETEYLKGFLYGMTASF